uniref:Uncharacterized protein n=1 Tax=Anguilla anguilla TaxID=7936 RepID=A0A0E9Q382_ANGAN
MNVMLPLAQLMERISKPIEKQLMNFDLISMRNKLN